MSDDSAEKPTIKRLPEDDLRVFVDDYVSGRIFTSAELQGENVNMEELARRIRMVFLPVALGALQSFEEQELENASIFYARMSEAMPMAVNGWPTFMSVRILHKDDWERLRPAILAEFERRKNIQIPPVQP